MTHLQVDRLSLSRSFVVFGVFVEFVEFGVSGVFVEFVEIMEFRLV